ncbi:MAG: hypothetical protein J0I65_27740 [Variovorax sp.]|nr:hypothetical protein [Variovorax sp.]
MNPAPPASDFSIVDALGSGLPDQGSVVIDGHAAAPADCMGPMLLEQLLV